MANVCRKMIFFLHFSELFICHSPVPFYSSLLLLYCLASFVLTYLSAVFPFLSSVHYSVRYICCFRLVLFVLLFLKFFDSLCCSCCFSLCFVCWFVLFSLCYLFFLSFVVFRFVLLRLLFLASLRCGAFASRCFLLRICCF